MAEKIESYILNVWELTNNVLVIKPVAARLFVIKFFTENYLQSVSKNIIENK